MAVGGAFGGAIALSQRERGQCAITLSQRERVGVREKAARGQSA
jgi:hypothetical protein